MLIANLLVALKFFPTFIAYYTSQMTVIFMDQKGFND